MYKENQKLKKKIEKVEIDTFNEIRLSYEQVENSLYSEINELKHQNQKQKRQIKTLKKKLESSSVGEHNELGKDSADVSAIEARQPELSPSRNSAREKLARDSVHALFVGTFNSFVSELRNSLGVGHKSGSLVQRTCDHLLPKYIQNFEKQICNLGSSSGTKFENLLNAQETLRLGKNDSICTDVIINDMLEAEALANQPDYRLNSKKLPQQKFSESIRSQSPLHKHISRTLSQNP